MGSVRAPESGERVDAEEAAAPTPAAAAGASPVRSAPLARALAMGAPLSNRAVAQLLQREPQGYGYSYADDPLHAGGFGPNDATMRFRPGPVRTTLLGEKPASPAEVPAAEPATAPAAQPGRIDWEARAAAAAKKIDDAGHSMGTALRGTGTAPVDKGGRFPEWFMQLQHKVSMTKEWGVPEEEASQVLRDFALSTLEGSGTKVPANLRFLFEYIGRSSINAASATKNKFKDVGVFGGGLDSAGNPTKNWCTATSSRGAQEGAKSIKGATFEGLSKGKLSGTRFAIYGKEAYDAALRPGDMVFYIFKGSQYGGHAVTVIEDLGSSFTHISGNTGDAIAVGVGEAKRMMTPPTGFELYKATPGPGSTPAETTQKQTAATNYIKNFAWGDQVLVYSIVRYGGALNAAEEASA
jgi:hypothetical protein